MYYMWPKLDVSASHPCIRRACRLHISESLLDSSVKAVSVYKEMLTAFGNASRLPLLSSLKFSMYRLYVYE